MMKFKVRIVVVHQRKARLTRPSPGDHLHRGRGWPVAIPLATTAQELGRRLRGIKEDDGHDAH